MAGSVSNDDGIGCLRLLRTAGIGGVTFYKLLAKFGSPAKAIDFLERERGIKVSPARDAERELAAAGKIGARALFSFEPEYPYLLKQVPDRPPALYVLGDVAALSKRSLAVVGSRNASMNSRDFTAALSRDIASAGYAVVSGMAIGIDTHAHIGALSSPAEDGAKTVAVLAGGVDVVYPLSNKGLYQKIIDRGAVISEMPPGTEPIATLFPRRNRIISGLSLGTLVVEASRKSGSLITARYAAAQGREVFAVPNFPLDPRAGGTNGLIKNGAALVESADDVLSVLDAMKPGYAAASPAPFSVMEEDGAFDAGDADLKDRILSLLSAQAVSVDSLLRELSGCPYAAVASALLELELDDRISYPSNGKVVLRM